jgi:hypothetical protein
MGEVAKQFRRVNGTCTAHTAATLDETITTDVASTKEDGPPDQQWTATEAPRQSGYPLR